MAVKTGSTAELRFQGAAIAKVRDVSLTIVRDALETTGIGQKDRTYAYGVRGTTGTGTLLYDAANAATTATMNRLLNDSESTDTIAMVLDTNVAEGTLQRKLASQSVLEALSACLSHLASAASPAVRSNGRPWHRRIT